MSRQGPIANGLRAQLGHSADWRAASERLDQQNNRFKLQGSPMAATRSRLTFQQNAISAALLLIVPVGVLALWLQDRWVAFKARVLTQTTGCPTKSFVRKLAATPN